MPTVEKVSGGEFYHRGTDRTYGVGDRADVSEGLAEYFCDERGDFHRVDGNEVTSGDDVGGYDNVTDFLDRTPVGDVADDILDGQVDDHLGAIEGAADRKTVEDAVDERRAELED